MWLAPLTTPAAYSSASACPAASVFAALVAAIVTNGLNDAKAKAKETRDVVEVGEGVEQEFAKREASYATRTGDRSSLDRDTVLPGRWWFSLSGTGSAAEARTEAAGEPGCNVADAGGEGGLTLHETHTGLGTRGPRSLLSVGTWSSSLPGTPCRLARLPPASLPASSHALPFRKSPSLPGAGAVSPISVRRYQDAGDQRPDVQVPIGGVLSFSKLPTACAAPDAAGTFFSRLSFGALNLHPKSRGQVLLNKTDPYGMPLIYNNVFGVASDVKPVIEAYKLAVKLNSTRAFRDNGITVTVGAPKACAQLPFNSDEYWLCSFQGRGKANQHPTSTCSMGPDSDAMAVVSPRLKVRGVSGLRVIDASVMPEATSGNTNAVCVMIGERGSDLIKQDHKQA